MRTTIRRDDVVDLVIGNRRPLAVYFDFVMVANHTALSRATVHEVAALAFAIVSVQLRVEALMPFIVAYPVISFLRRCAYTKKHGERTAERGDERRPSARRRRNAAGENALCAMIRTVNAVSLRVLCVADLFLKRSRTSSYRGLRRSVRRPNCRTNCRSPSTPRLLGRGILAHSFHKGRTQTRGHEATKEAAMKAFERSWDGGCSPQSQHASGVKPEPTSVIPSGSQSQLRRRT